MSTTPEAAPGAALGTTNVSTPAATSPATPAATAALSPSAPPDGLDRLLRAAALSRAAASGLRWLGACALTFAALLSLALLLALFDRSAAAEAAPEVSASAFLDYDLAVLRVLATQSLAGKAHLPALWAQRPAWKLPQARSAAVRLVPLRDAWAATVSGKSRFRTAARGALQALPFLLAGLALAFLSAALGGALAHLRKPWALALGALALVALPLARLLDPALFYDRTRSLGLGLGAALFVGSFAGASAGAAARALASRAPQTRLLAALGGRPAFFTAARLAALEAAEWLVPLVPALAAAALFVCAKADQDPSLAALPNGLGALIRGALAEPSAAERLASCTLAAGGLGALWFAGHRFVLEVRAALGLPA